MTDTSQNTPSFEGLILEQDQEWQYYFWYPKGWHRYELGDGRTGVLCSPEDEHPTTYFSVETQRLPAAVLDEDVEVLRQGIQEGLSQLPDMCIASTNDTIAGGRIVFEREFTFADGDTVRKRRIRLIYAGSTLYSLISQGSSEQDYKYWLSMLNYCQMTFEIGTFDTADL